MNNINTKPCLYLKWIGVDGWGNYCSHPNKEMTEECIKENCQYYIFKQYEEDKNNG